MDHGYSGLLDVLVLLTAAVIGVAVVRRLRGPSILAYLAIGIAVGPSGFAVLKESHEVDRFAEFGVVFLMFSVGLEFSLARLRAMRRMVLGFGAAQVGLTAAGTALVTVLFYGQSWRAGAAVGLAVAMSSTAIVAKLLSERLDLHSRSGRQTMGALLFQDLAVVPCLIVLPALASPGAGLLNALALALAQAALALAVLVWVGQRFMRRFYDAVARARSDELFVLSTLWIAVGLAYATGRAGLSLALGAFVAGMLISETVYRHQVEADMRPFRDILLGLFFVTVGMMLDLRFVAANLHALLLALVLLIAGKAIVVLVIARVIGNAPEVALRTAAQLAQAGEFGLVLIDLARSQGLVGQDIFQLTLAAMLLSMFIAPFLVHHVGVVGGWIGRRDRADVVGAVATVTGGAIDHVIVCGYGRTGQRVAQFLGAEGFAFVALDADPELVKRAGKEAPVAFGSADRAEVLNAAGLHAARAVVVAYPDAPSALRLVRRVRSVRKDIPVIVRAPDETHIAALKAAGATEVVPEVLEGSLMIAAETLAQLGVPVERALARVRAVRSERYGTLREFYRRER
ncbi:MAG: cation:proton antiporter [Burkholderiales bacterium]|nr:cation:proton antiporter [Burkholderiales bacterium]